ncbi:MAG: YtxH domain-containing protein [Nitrospirota bacterium]
MEKMERTMAMVAVFSFLLGGAVGAGVALLLAPQSGKKTRRQIHHFAEDLAGQATDYAERLKKRVL